MSSHVTHKIDFHGVSNKYFLFSLSFFSFMYLLFLSFFFFLKYFQQVWVFCKYVRLLFHIDVFIGFLLFSSGFKKNLNRAGQSVTVLCNLFFDIIYLNKKEFRLNKERVVLTVHMMANLKKNLNVLKSIKRKYTFQK
jgi:hypothetical protein